MPDTHRHRPDARSWLLALCLALLLPLAQFGAVAHALSHEAAAGLAGKAGGEPTLPHDGCDVCAGYSVFGGAGDIALPAFSVLALAFVAPQARPRAASAHGPVAAYRTRAPPSILA